MKEPTLPTKAVKAARKSPRHLIIYGPPKIGKTTALAKLDDCLILDLEEGSDMLDALKIKVNSLEELEAVGKQIIKQGKPYKYIAVDTITKLEAWCEAEGKKMYQQTPMGKNFDLDRVGLSVLSLPNGAGYLYLRKAFEKWFNRLGGLADHVIFVGHLKDKMIDKKGKEVRSEDLDLTGKLRSISCASADAIGYIYREDDVTKISFDSGGDRNAGSRCEHLRGRDMELDWKNIFID